MIIIFSFFSLISEPIILQQVPQINLFEANKIYRKYTLPIQGYLEKKGLNPNFNLIFKQWYGNGFKTIKTVIFWANILMLLTIIVFSLYPDKNLEKILQTLDGVQILQTINGSQTLDPNAINALTASNALKNIILSILILPAIAYGFLSFIILGFAFPDKQNYNQKSTLDEAKEYLYISHFFSHLNEKYKQDISEKEVVTELKDISNTETVIFNKNAVNIFALEDFLTKNKFKIEKYMPFTKISPSKTKLILSLNGDFSNTSKIFLSILNYFIATCISFLIKNLSDNLIYKLFMKYSAKQELPDFNRSQQGTTLHPSQQGTTLHPSQQGTTLDLSQQGQTTQNSQQGQTMVGYTGAQTQVRIPAPTPPTNQIIQTLTSLQSIHLEAIQILTTFVQTIMIYIVIKAVVFFILNKIYYYKNKSRIQFLQHIRENLPQEIVTENEILEFINK